MQMLLIPSQAVMNGFCYAYCRALLETLKFLVLEKLTDEKKDLTRAVCSHLGSQLNIQIEAKDEDIKTVEQFLAIFER